MYQLLAAPPYLDAVDWQNLEVFFSDERSGSSDDVNSRTKSHG